MEYLKTLLLSIVILFSMFYFETNKWYFTGYESGEYYKVNDTLRIITIERNKHQMHVLQVKGNCVFIDTEVKIFVSEGSKIKLLQKMKCNWDEFANEIQQNEY